uniref:Uncharacterized protein n=1 Tax=viral metagenome TaxID=1070528 RepID=A0A2V0RLN9_9ZZZZ
MSNSQGPTSDCEYVSACSYCDNMQRGHQYHFENDMGQYGYIFICLGCLPPSTKIDYYEHDCISEIIDDEVPHSEGCPYGMSWSEIFEMYKTENFDIIVRGKCERPSCPDPYRRWVS